jgi:hypothetical protein
MQEQWFPAKDSRTVMGRFREIEVIDPVKSAELDQPVTKLRLALESKVVGSHDVAVQAVKPFNKRELSARFPGAMEHYEASKEQPQIYTPAPVVQTVPGTPLADADFIPRDRIEWLAMQGIQTVEQIRDLSDSQIQGMGREMGKWRKQADAFLKRT